MKKHSEAVEKYQKKVGLVSKSYKLSKEVVDEFSLACQKNKTTQAKELTRMMTEYIKKPS